MRAVSAINATQVEVTFNTAIKRVSAETLSNYTLKTVAGATQALESVSYVSDTKVILNLDIDDTNADFTTDVALANGTEYELTVSKELQDAKGTTLGTDSKTKFTFTDSTLPTISKVTTLGIREILVEFTEPVRPGQAGFGNVEDNFSLKALDKDGIPQAELLGTSDTIDYLGTDRKAIKITLAGTNTLQSGVKYNLAANTASAAAEKLRDYAGYVLPSTTQVVEYVVDTTVPQITDVAVISQGAVELKFNKPVDSTTGTFYWNADGVEANNSKTGTATPVNSNTLRVDFGTNLIPAGTAYIFATGVEDYNGNAIATTKKQVTVANDLQPTVNSAQLTSKTSIEVKFNTDLTATTSNYTLKNDKGQLVAITGISQVIHLHLKHIL